MSADSATLPDAGGGGRDAGLCVRAPRKGDLAAVVRIERGSFGDPWPPDSLRAELRPDALRLPLIAEMEGEVVGYLLAWRVAEELHVLNLAVAGQARRRGIATRLLRAACDEARERGQTVVTLEVRPSNAAARAFYRRHGFRETGRRARYYRDTGEDALILSLILEPETAPGPGAGG